MFSCLIVRQAVVSDVLLGRVQAFLFRFGLEMFIVIVRLVHLSL